MTTTNNERVKMNTLILRDDRKLVQTFSSTDYNEYDVINVNTNVRICSVFEYFVSPIDNKVLDHTVYEVYYDYDSEFDEYLGSTVFDEIEEVEQLINSDYL